MGESTCRVMRLNAIASTRRSTSQHSYNRAEHLARDHHVGVAAIEGRIISGHRAAAASPA